MTTVPMTLGFLRGQASFMSAHGIAFDAVSSPGEDLEAFAQAESVRVHGVGMTRKITPLKDVIAVGRLVRTLRSIGPDIVHAHTPKGGLIGMIAAAIAQVPRRIYHMRGLPFSSATGLKRMLLVLTERVSCLLATRVICVSHSLRELAIQEGVVTPEKARVLGAGSGQGVDAQWRFDPGRFSSEERLALRRMLGIPEDASVIGFVGRIVRDKGIVELLRAWKELRAMHPNVRLVIVGFFEEQDPVPEWCREMIETDTKIHMVGRQLDTARFYAVMDILVLPTYREGFPNVPLEAAAMGVPVVATRVEGCVDAVADGVSGVLVRPRCSTELLSAVAYYLANPAIRVSHGAEGRRRVLALFRREDVWSALLDEYRDLLGCHAAQGASSLASNSPHMAPRDWESAVKCESSP